MTYLIFSLAIITAIKQAHLSRAFVATIAALALGIVAPASSADDDIPFDEAEIFFEHRQTACRSFKVLTTWRCGV